MTARRDRRRSQNSLSNSARAAFTAPMRRRERDDDHPDPDAGQRSGRPSPACTTISASRNSSTGSSRVGAPHRQQRQRTRQSRVISFLGWQGSRRKRRAMLRLAARAAVRRTKPTRSAPRHKSRPRERALVHPARCGAPSSVQRVSITTSSSSLAGREIADLHFGHGIGALARFDARRAGRCRAGAACRTARVRTSAGNWRDRRSPDRSVSS